MVSRTRNPQTKKKLRTAALLPFPRRVVEDRPRVRVNIQYLVDYSTARLGPIIDMHLLQAQDF